MRSAVALVGLGALTLAVGQADYTIADQMARERYLVTTVGRLVPRPVRSLAECAALEGLALEPACPRAPCGSVFNVTTGRADEVLVRCELPVSR